MFKSIITIVFTGILALCFSNSYSQVKSKPEVEPKPQVKSKPEVEPKPQVKSKPEVEPKLQVNAIQQISVQEDLQNQLGLIYTVKKLDEARKLIEDENCEEAEKILLDAKSWLTDATEFHYNLYQLYNRQQKNISLAKIEKAHAADFGHVRDQSYFLLAKAYIGENKFREAVSMLVEIIKSQNGTILSEQAYKTLQEIKFSDKPK